MGVGVGVGGVRVEGPLLKLYRRQSIDTTML